MVIIVAKKEAKETSKPKKVEDKKKSSMRESALKSREAAKKPKRVRKAASAATKPVGKLGRLLTAEYHLINNEKQGFFTKSRKFTPKYFRNSAKELKNVTWPGRKETWRLVFAVFVFAIIMGTFIAVLDYGLEKILREVIL